MEKKARLIKQDTKQQQQKDTSGAVQAVQTGKPVPSVQQEDTPGRVVENVRTWLEQKRKKAPLRPHEMFAALFTPGQTLVTAGES